MQVSDSIGIHPALALDAADIGIWEWRPDSGAMSCDFRTRSLFGMAADARTFDAFLASVHPEDRGRTRTVWHDAARDERPRRCECRPALSTTAIERWVAMSGRVCVFDTARHVLGVAMDISALKETELRRELIAQDIEHRMINIFSVVAAIVSLSQRTAGTPEQLASGLRTRLGALARSHIVLTSTAPGTPVQLRRVIEAQLAPFVDFSRVTISGPPTELDHGQAMALNMITHELTTNAVKHGALSPEGGEVAIHWSIEPSLESKHLLLTWKETCRSQIKAPAHAGLGSKLLVTSARVSLGGDICFDYQRDGLLATLAMPMARFTADAASSPP